MAYHIGEALHVGGREYIDKRCSGFGLEFSGFYYLDLFMVLDLAGGIPRFCWTAGDRHAGAPISNRLTLNLHFGVVSSLSWVLAAGYWA